MSNEAVTNPASVNSEQPHQVVTNPPPTNLEDEKVRARLNVKQQLSLSALIGLIILAIILVVVVRPIWGQITTINQEIVQLEQDLSALKQKEAKIKQAQSSYGQIVNDLPMIKTAVPTDSQVPLVMKTIEKKASEIVESGGAMVLSKISINQMPNDLPVDQRVPSSKMIQRTPVEVTISTRGNYQAIRDFVRTLRLERHNYELDKIVFFTSGQDSPFLDANLTIKYYYYE